MTDTIALARARLVLVDYQARLLPAIHDADTVLAEAARLAGIARALGVPVIGTEQNPTGLGHTAPALRERLDEVVSKMHFDACEDGLVARLGAGGPHDVVVAGCETHVCLLQTALGLRRAGQRVWVAANACGSRRPAEHALALERLRGAGIGVVSVEMAAFEWLHHCAHPDFKAVLSLVKPLGPAG
ncbi:MAG: isochorismatase family protein [Rhizobacter sp.]